MQILVIGKFHTTSWCVGLAHALRALGHGVDTAELNAPFATTLAKSATADLTILIKGTGFDERQILQMRGYTRRLLFYTGDSITVGPPGRIDSIAKKAVLCDAVALSGYEGCKWIHDNHPTVPLAQIYQGHRTDVFRSPDMSILPKRMPGSQEHLVFFGCFYDGDGGRQEGMRYLTRAGFTVRQSNSTWLHQAAYAYYNAAFSLNFVCGDITSSRLLRIMASGGVALTQGNKDIRHSFTHGKDLLVFNTFKEMHALATEYMPKRNARQQMAVEARLTARAYTWEQQASKMLKFAVEDVPVSDGAAAEFIPQWR